ncbi:MAG: hypothetical protein MJZ86_01000 [Bacteroidales bacterium]|nr:hypothetical protein [Bacteroidales bacterium]
MKKVFLFFAAATLLALGMTSCQKDQSEIKYTATIERATAKTSVERLDNFNVSHPVVWERGDEITIFRASDGMAFTFITDDNNTDNAVFHLEGQGDCSALHGEAVNAGYPAEYFHHQAQIQIPSIQNYKNHNVIKYPMYATASSGESELAFKNLCGILRIKMPKYASTDLHVDVTKVMVWANQQISGIFDIRNGGTEQQYLHPVDGPDEITMNFENSISLNGDDNEYIYIYLPAANYTTLAFQFYTTESEGKYLEVKSTQSITISRSQVHTIDLTHITPAREHWTATPEPPSPDFYSVSPTLQVDFAKGNLLCNNDTWRNAETQGFISNNTNNVYDFFARSVDGNGFGKSGMTTDEDDMWVVNEAENFTILGDFRDWGWTLHPGTSYMQYKELDYRWRTLSSEEWDYLMYGRPNALSLHFMVSVVNGDEITHGFFIFPDGWTNPNNITLGNASYIEREVDVTGEPYETMYIQSNAITTAEYNTLLSQGTFLPAAGQHIGTMGNIYQGYGGCYWASDYSVNYHEARQFWPEYAESTEFGVSGYGKYFHAGQQLRDRDDWGYSMHAYFTVRLAFNAKRKNETTGSWALVPNPNTTTKGKRK